MRRWIVLFALLVATPASAAAQWSLGSNLGVSFFEPEDGEGSTVIGFPGAVGSLQPGLRIGRAQEFSKHEFFTDLGLLMSSGGAISADAFEMTLNYQYNFSDERSGPYLTAGGGVYNTSFEVEVLDATIDYGATSAVFGFGGGLRTKLGDSGTLRFEGRYDFVGEGKDDDVVVQPSGSALGFRFGFDVWL